MALLWMEGFEGYSSYADIMNDNRYAEDTTSGAATLVSGRGGGQALQCANSAMIALVILPQNSSSTIYGGFAFKDTSSTTSIRDIFHFGGDSSATPTFYVGIYNKTVYISTSLSDTTPLVSARYITNVWHYVSFKIFLNNSTGTIDLYLDGVLEDSGTGLDTIGSGADSTIKVITFDAPNLYTSVLFDDIYFGDDSGSDLTDIVKEIAIESLLPDGAGGSSQFTPLSGSNYQNVDETTSDGDTTYNSSSTATHKDLFTTASMSTTSGTVYAVQVKNKFSKDDASYRTVKNKIKSSATESDGSTTGATYSEYKTNVDIFENDPNGGGNWTISSVNAIEIGYEVVD